MTVKDCGPLVNSKEQIFTALIDTCVPGIVSANFPSLSPSIKTGSLYTVDFFTAYDSRMTVIVLRTNKIILKIDISISAFICLKYDSINENHINYEYFLACLFSLVVLFGKFHI